MNENKKYWSRPKAVSVGLFTDLLLPLQALEIGLMRGVLNISTLKELLPERIIGLKYIAKFQNRTFQDLIRELHKFKLIRKKTNSSDFIIARKGKDLVETYYTSQEKYYLLLTEYMQDTYVIPGWIINRLWKINPAGQGQVIIPAPMKDWSPKARKWFEKDWDFELENVSVKTFKQIHFTSAHSFPIEEDCWINMLKNEYLRLGELRPRTSKVNEMNSSSFSPRRRLSQAMKNCAVKYFFSNNWDGEDDFYTKRSPINTRTFMVWCPRLETMEFLFYTDYNENVPGRIIFPISIFRKDSDNNWFRVLQGVKSPEGKILHVYSPRWSDIKSNFIKVLIETYQKFYNKQGIIYISLQDVRDEVCRILRISARSFEIFVELAFQMSLKKEIEYAIALETDIRQDQKASYQSTRRNVVINKTPYSLIAIKKY